MKRNLHWVDVVVRAEMKTCSRPEKHHVPYAQKFSKTCMDIGFR